ncbi:MAG: glycerol-3-phosphate dehydrogenase/oxidase [Chloroflexota bacterium]
MTGQLAADARRRAFAALSDTAFDILIIGGGIVASGALLDATSRGLRAAIVERDDLGVGTSSRSSRLIHGGLRYLEQYHFGLVGEALAERARLLRNAPHLVRIEPFLFPLFGFPVVTRSFYQAGMTLYDVLGARRDGGWHRHRSVDATLEHVPGLRRPGLRGSLIYHDAVHDDARTVLSVARTAELAGGTVATRTAVESLVEEGGRVVGARVRDRVGGGTLVVRARSVVDATGAWATDPASPLSGGSNRILSSQGSHLIVRRERIPSDIGLTMRVPGKVVFLVPWPHHWIIGTTDAPYDGPVDRPAASAPEVDELLEAVNRAMDVDLRRDDIVGTYSGLRPLLAPSGGTTVTASREHKVTEERNGLVRISGGKFTTYRIMARDAVDAALRRVGEDPRARPTGTADIKLVGAADLPELDRIAAGLQADHGLTAEVATRLVHRHGRHAAEVAALGAKEGLLAQLGPAIEHLEAEVVWAARHEHALGLDDVLARRMRLAQELPDRGAAIATRVAHLLGAELGWDAHRRANVVADYLEGARREYGVPA